MASPPPPSAPRLTLTNVGPVKQADIVFGDLTVFVGAQATGKSIALQLLNYAVDSDTVVWEMVRYGLDWKGNYQQFWDLYLGEGMHSIWPGPNAGATWRDLSSRTERPISTPRRPRKAEPPLREEKLFYIPAQRVLTMPDGWPRAFREYALGDPYVVKAFSERIRVLLDQGFRSSRTEALFPQTGRLKGALRDAVRDAIFHDFELALDVKTPRLRLVLRRGDIELPFMVWSAGQREFVPLLAGLYWLLPPTKTTRRGQVEWVVIEEPEAGLHPRAISTVMLLVLELMHRGYRVALSTHSPQVLDVVWAVQRMSETTADPHLLLDAFAVLASPKMLEVAKSAFGKHYRTYYFQRDGVVRDISNLDPGAEADEEADWGGLSEFSGRMADAVGEAVVRAEGT